MNQNYYQMCKEMENGFYSLSREELLDELTVSQNMALLCHASNALDHKTLLYFSVHNMYLRSDNYSLLIFSECGFEEIPKDADPGYRIFLYRIIAKEVKEVFDRQYSYYMSQLDGRLVVLILYSLFEKNPQERSDVLDESCLRVADACLQKYDIKISVSRADNIDDLSIISSKYSELISQVELLSFMETPGAASRFPLDTPGTPILPPPALPTRLEPYTKEIANTLLNHENCTNLTEAALDIFRSAECRSISDIKVSYKEFLEKKK